MLSTFGCATLLEIVTIEQKFLRTGHTRMKVDAMHVTIDTHCKNLKTRMWANAQRDGRPVEHRWRPLFDATKFGSRPLLDCRAVTLPRRESR